MASINDVAKLAHVSKSTVSLVINETGYVSEETRKKVEDAIKKLNYTPNRLAQGLSKNHSGLIAVVVPDVSHPYFATLLKSIEQSLAEDEYMTIVCSVKEDENKEKWYLEMLNRGIVDGIITAGHTIDLTIYNNSSRPIISIDRYINDKIPIVHSDHKQAAEIAVKLLLEAGCKNIVQFVGTSHIGVQSHTFNEILKSNLEISGVQVNQFYIGHNSFKVEEYKESAKKLFESDITFDGIVGVDSSILACIQEAGMRGIDVPDQVKMLSYDGTYMTELNSPALTTIVQPISQLGRSAAELVVKQIRKDPLEELRYIFPVTLRKGKTC